MILLSALTPPPLLLTNHTAVNLCVAGEGSDAGVVLPAESSVDFDWCVFSRAVREKRGSEVSSGSPEAYWSAVEKSERVSMSLEKRKEYRVVLFTFYDYNQLSNHYDVSLSCGIEMKSVSSPDQTRAWSKPFWLTKTQARHLPVTLNGVRHTLYLYTYRLHNVSVLEVFDAVPSLVLSPLQASCTQLRHYDRLDYTNPIATATTDSDSLSDSSFVSLSSVLPSLSSASAANYAEFAIRSFAPADPATASQIAYHSAYTSTFNVQVVARVPSVCVSLYQKENGVYNEVVLAKTDSLLLTLQRGGCALFSRCGAAL